MHDPFTTGACFDLKAMARVVAVAVRMLDNVLDATEWPLPRQQWEAQAKRRIGLGVTGLGDALIMVGVRYDSEAGRHIAAALARFIRDAAYQASIELSREKGAFPVPIEDILHGMSVFDAAVRSARSNRVEPVEPAAGEERTAKIMR